MTLTVNPREKSDELPHRTPNMMTQPECCSGCRRTVRRDERLLACRGACGTFLHPSCTIKPATSIEELRCEPCIGREPHTVGESANQAPSLMARILSLTDLVMELKTDLSDARAEIKLLKAEKNMLPTFSTPKTRQKPVPSRNPATPLRTAASGLFHHQSQNNTPSAGATSTRKRTAEDQSENIPKAPRTDLTAVFTNIGSRMQTFEQRETRAERNSRHRTLQFGTSKVAIPSIVAAPRASRSQDCDRVLLTRVFKNTGPREVLDFALTLTAIVKRVIKLKTRSPFPTFSSFVIETKVGDGKLVNNPDKWPVDVAVRRFGGVPRDEQIDLSVSPGSLDNTAESSNTIVMLETAGDSQVPGAPQTPSEMSHTAN